MKNIFILEDSKTDAHHLEALLKKNGYQVIGMAKSGPEAIEMVPKLKPDLIFADIILEGKKMDGIDAALEIRKQFNVPVIFLTSYSEEHLIDRALTASPYAYLIKPVNEDQLRVTLETTKNRLKLEKEKEALVDQLFQSQKMEAVGHLAGGMAHNYNNILSIVLGNAELAMNNMDKDDPNHDRMQRILRSGARAKDLAEKLLSLSRKEKADVKSASVNEILGDMLDILKESISKNIILETMLAEGLPAINVDTNQIIQAILNVCMNACDSMPRGGDLSIESRKIVLDEKDCEGKFELKPGEYNLVRIQDTGGGIPAPDRERLFEPFFTTREKGTGLGLFVTQNIIKSHNGHIAIASELGLGTTVDIYLPVSGASEEPAEVTHEQTMSRGKNEVILIVDDEEDFLDMVSETLQLNGYRTFSANVGSKAVELFRSHRDEIKLVLLDIMMPEMQGDEVFYALKKITPNVKVVLCSGYSDKVKVSGLLKDGVAAFIQKPFVTPELENVISDVLSA